MSTAREPRPHTNAIEAYANNLTHHTTLGGIVSGSTSTVLEKFGNGILNFASSANSWGNPNSPGLIVYGEYGGGNPVSIAASMTKTGTPFGQGQIVVYPGACCGSWTRATFPPARA